MRAFALALAVLTCFAQPSQAGDRVTLGFGRLFSNDYLGDNHDRWRTGAYVVSWLRGPAGTEARGDFGEVLEYRFGAAMITPASLTAPAADDRAMRACCPSVCTAISGVVPWNCPQALIWC